MPQQVSPVAEVRLSPALGPMVMGKPAWMGVASCSVTFSPNAVGMVRQVGTLPRKFRRCDSAGLRSPELYYSALVDLEA